MSNQAPCCHELTHLRSVKSPFTSIIALDWYDGPRAGLLHCGVCSREFRFELLDELVDEKEAQDFRIFSLGSVAKGSIARLSDALSPYETPRSPVWVPHWKFPTETEQTALDRLSDRILDEAAPPELVIATPDISEMIAVAKTVTPEDLVQVTDWFSFLGLVRQDPAPPPHRAST
jgi:hypothetical protein